jgi:hypothetical protein
MTPWLWPFRCAPCRSPRFLTRVRPLTEMEISELELATDEALGRVEPE